MSSSAILLAPLVATIALAPVVWLLQMNHKEERSFLRSQLRSEKERSQTLLNMMASKDFQVFAGMQSLTGTPLASSASEYIPRDDVSEYRRINAMNKTGIVSTDGYGETLFDMDTDPELALAISEMTRNGQINYDSVDG